MIQQFMRRRSIILLIAAIAILVIVPMKLPNYFVQMLAQFAIMALFATSLNMEMGFAGMMPIGQGTFLGLGAYSFAILFNKADLSLPISIVLGLIVCVILNGIIGWLCLRGRAMTFGLLHMAFNLLFSTMVYKWISLTGGDTGLTVKRTGMLANNYYYFLIVLAIILICYLIIRIILFSPFGKIAQGLRENEERLIFLGINTKNYQLVLFIIAGFFSGVAGILLTMLNGGAFPAYSQMLYSAEAMMMCLIGGAFTFWGPTLGAALVVLFTDTVSGLTQYWQGIMGAVMVAVVLGFRGGILRRGTQKIKTPSTVMATQAAAGSDKTTPEGTLK